MPLNTNNNFIELIQKHSGIIRKIVSLYIDNYEDQNDLQQEIILQAWKSFSKFRFDSSFSTWLYKIALNTTLTYHKKEQTRIKTIDIDDAILLEKDSNYNEDHELLYNLIRSLNDIDKTIITLHLDGYKNKEIVEIIGINQNMVNVKIFRIKKLIIQKFKEVQNGSK